jgi:hypothetical protein
MGELSCNRCDCDNVMCDRFSHNYGYICSECFSELIGLGPETNIKSFMERGIIPNQERQAYARFNVEFEMMD